MVGVNFYNIKIAFFGVFLLFCVKLEALRKVVVEKETEMREFVNRHLLSWVVKARGMITIFDETL